ncbi:MAG: response regulator [Frankiales bacterium]|nr:response regulator [Frankiales bacterium]
MIVAASPAPPAPLALVVEDEDQIRQVVAAYLERDGFTVIQAADGLDAVTQAEQQQPDVIVLDLMLPGLDGVEVCRRIRTFSDTYIVMVTARTEEVDTLIGLSVGADDYMTKPFSPRELVARIRTIMRRPRNQPQPGRRCGGLIIDPDARQVTLDGELVDLTRTEFDILDVLSANPRHVHPRERLVDDVWGPGWVGDPRLVDVHVSHIRAKLGDDISDPRFIVTVRGVGFRMGTG